MSFCTKACADALIGAAAKTQRKEVVARSSAVRSAVPSRAKMGSVRSPFLGRAEALVTRSSQGKLPKNSIAFSTRSTTAVTASTKEIAEVFEDLKKKKQYAPFRAFGPPNALEFLFCKGTSGYLTSTSYTLNGNICAVSPAK
eukprot:1153780-Pyramimonas_sp.AAC.1